MLAKDSRVSKWPRGGEDRGPGLSAKPRLSSVVGGPAPATPWAGQRHPPFCVSPTALCVSPERCSLVHKNRKKKKKIRALFGESNLRRRISSLIRNKLRTGRSGFNDQLCYRLALTLRKSLNCVISPCGK